MEERFLSFVCFLSVAADLAGVEGVGPGGDVAQHHAGHEALDGLYLLLAHLDLPRPGACPHRGRLRKLLRSLSGAECKLSNLY